MMSLYRHYSKDDELLYVGVSVNVFSRFVAHKNTSHWIFDVSRMEIEYFKNKEEALCAESVAILKEKPMFNVATPRGTSKPMTMCDIAQRIKCPVEMLRQAGRDGEFATITDGSSMWASYLQVAEWYREKYQPRCRKRAYEKLKGKLKVVKS